MFVLCPHCHFLVGMDPRTGGPPAACPKCGGTVVEPVAAKTPDAPALDPFAPLSTTSGGWFASFAGFTHHWVRAAKSFWNAGRHRDTVVRASVTLPTVSVASR